MKLASLRNAIHSAAMIGKPFPILLAMLAFCLSDLAFAQSKEAVEQYLNTIQLAKTIESGVKPQQSLCSISALSSGQACPTNSIRNEQCTEENSYLEGQLNSASSDRTLRLLGDLKNRSVIKRSCVESAMTTVFADNSTRFGACNAEGKKRQTVRPCVNDKYLDLVHLSFEGVNRCLSRSIDPNASESELQNQSVLLMGMFAQESGFHINAISPFGSSGLGQLTGNLIKDLNESSKKTTGGVSNIKEILTASSDSVCRSLADQLIGSKNMQASTCSRISIYEGNPVLNLAYSYLGIAKNRMQISKRLVYLKQKYPNLNLSDKELNRLAVRLSVWAHNTGLGGIMTPLNGLLSSDTKSFTTADDVLNSMRSANIDFPHENNSRRTKETSGYYPRILGRIADFNEANNGSCLAGGSL